MRHGTAARDNRDLILRYSDKPGWIMLHQCHAPIAFGGQHHSDRMPCVAPIAGKSSLHGITGMFKSIETRSENPAFLSEQ